MQRAHRQQLRRTLGRSAGTAPLRRPGAVGRSSVAGARGTPGHPLSRGQENAGLFDYESGVKAAFDAIVPTLKQISGLQHEADFERRAQQLAQAELGFELPEAILRDAWIAQLDMPRLFAWCVFETYRRYCDQFYATDPLVAGDTSEFESFLQACGFHTLDISPCADGRLAHLVRYVLRLPHRSVRRKSYAGAMFDVDDSIQKWVETEMLRFREGRPNTADAPTRYLKLVAYHHSSVDPEHAGCAAHGSDTQRAAAAGLERLQAFQQAIENTFCCGASIDLLLIGIDTDTDAIRVHVPDARGAIDLNRYVDALALFEATREMTATQAADQLGETVRSCSPDVVSGMACLVERLLEHNLSQIDYVRGFHGRHYPDGDHAERFIGAGVGFEEVQLRNLMYFAYLDTVEEAAQDLDVGVKIFSALNVYRGLPIPIVVRFDYHGRVPGARERAVTHCRRVAEALFGRYADLTARGLLHVMQVVRDCNADASIEVLECSANAAPAMGAH